MTGTVRIENKPGNLVTVEIQGKAPVTLTAGQVLVVTSDAVVYSSHLEHPDRKDAT